jgi:selenide,water dikinase
MNQSPVYVDLVLLGGGHAHIEVIRRFGMNPVPGVRLTIISREIQTPYSGMLPGLVAGHYGFDETHIDLTPLARGAGARLYQDEVVGLDLPNRRVLLRTRPPVAYDWLSIDTGSAPSLDAQGALEHAIPVKPVGSFHPRWEHLRERVLATREPLRIGVVGGGAGGVELLMAVRHRLRSELARAGDDANRLSFHLVSAAADILPGHGARARRLYRAALLDAGVELHLGGSVAAVDASSVTTTSGARIALDEVLWVTHAAAPAWPAAAGLATTEDGFIRVDACLRSVSHPEVFAAGDIAHVDPYPRPKAGVYAVRQGPRLATNLHHALLGRRLEAFRPQRDALSIISTGGAHAIASRGPFAVAGAWVWRWKDRIDRRFVERYTRPVATRQGAMPAPLPTMFGATQDEAMRCGGCGAKLGAEALRGALDGLRLPARDDVLIGLDAPDDAAVVALPPAALAVQTVDHFRSFIDDPWLFGRIAANHCLGDIFAMGAVPQTALAIVTLPYASPGKMREELSLLLAGATSLLEEEHTALVGGHTGEGAELALGFAVNGHALAHELLRKGGAEAGDLLILTKPLGTGVLLAAHMRALARWPSLSAALESMAQSNGAAARCLREHGVHAMTDVTGFGLAGHLLEMLRNSQLSTSLALSSLPIFDGAVALARQGVLSSLHPDNLRVLGQTNVDATLRAHPHFNLCFDPQTAGGLLCAVPRTRAAACLAALHRAGYPAATVIGEFFTRGAREPALHFEG